jgi:hypothetical protein
LEFIDGFFGDFVELILLLADGGNSFGDQIFFVGCVFLGSAFHFLFHFVCLLFLLFFVLFLVFLSAYFDLFLLVVLHHHFGGLPLLLLDEVEEFLVVLVEGHVVRGGGLFFHSAFLVLEDFLLGLDQSFPGLFL